MKNLLILVVLIISSISFSQEKYTASEASKHIGETAIVTGTVVQVSTPSNGIIYLNIDEKYPNNEFTAVIFKKYAELFPDAKKLEGKKVEISGKIEDYKGKPQIVVKKVEQIKLIEE